MYLLIFFAVHKYACKRRAKLIEALWGMDESWHTYERFMSHTWMHHVTHTGMQAAREIDSGGVKEARQNIALIKVAQMCCGSFMCDVTHLHVWHDPFVCVAWLHYMCGMTHLCMWQDSLVCVTWRFLLSQGCPPEHIALTKVPCVWYDSFICVALLFFHICD